MANSSKITLPVDIEGGKVTGIYEDQGKVAVFKGIPYAKPPVGENRE
ncbi:MAG: carboxylesterase family protein [Proteobacteria bacterium]|nr:carboxylesterase family protein [Pseudomonadota bacterium]